jgi:transposase
VAGERTPIGGVLGAITTAGLDVAKNVFQARGVDADGKALVRRQLRHGDVLKFFEGL